MAGLWEGLPASPCSAASDEDPIRNMKPPAHYANAHLVSRPSQAISPVSDVQFSTTKRPLGYVDSREDNSATPRLTKRSRSNPMHSMDATNTDSGTAHSGRVEFVEAKESNTESNSDFVAQLNTTAADERRKALLQRLRDIDAKKARLASSSPTSETAAPSPSTGDEIIVLDDSSSRSSVPEVSKTKPPVRPSTTRKRSSRSSGTRRGAKSRTLSTTSSVNSIIDVDAQSSSTSKSVKRRTSASKSTRAVVDLTTAGPKRASSRVRRPRLPNVDGTVPGESKRAPTPVCMAKCKRFQFCKKLVTSLLRNSSAAPFSAPVRQLWAPETIPRYFDVITRPMDLSTVKRNLENSEYITAVSGDILPYRFEVENFSEDVRQVFRNAMVYNRVGDMLYNCAQSLMNEFESTLKTQLPSPPSPAVVKAALSRKRPSSRKVRSDRHTAIDDSDSSALTVTKVPVKSPAPAVPASATAKASKLKSWAASVAKTPEVTATADLLYETESEIKERLKYLRNCRPAVIARKPVPKGEGYLSRAALLYDVEISYQQKVRISKVITEGKVPASKVEGLVSLVKQTTGDNAEASPDEEYELELDNLDNKGWRNLEAFLEQYVPGFKTIRSSCLGREFSSVSDVDEEIRVLENRLAESKVEPAKPRRKATPVVDKPKSFFGDEPADGDSSSDSSDGESDSDSSDSESDEE